MKHWLVMSGLAAVLAMATTAGAGQEKPAAQAGAKHDTSASADAMFMRQASMDGMAEVEHGRAAAANAENDEVKKFAQRMVDDHSKAGEELKSLASQKHVTLATTLDQKHRAMQEKLGKMKGHAFDHAYMQHMVEAHKQAVSLFQREAKSGKDSDARAWAEKTLPTLQEHVKMATELHAKLGKSPTR
jgi:putative membrane protein